MYYIDIKEGEEINEDYVRASLDKILEYLKEDGEFSISFIDDEEIKSLNKEYRDIDSPTDILTFRLDDDDSFPTVEEEEKELGDIFISLDSMARNAEEFGVEKSDELRRLLLHGVLHLEGYDHKTNDFKTEPMLIKQEEILNRIFG